eukprot:SAG11_NODE_8170_length_1045_cov_4.421826_1_plen_37_part_10
MVVAAQISVLKQYPDGERVVVEMISWEDDEHEIGLLC